MPRWTWGCLKTCKSNSKNYISLCRRLNVASSEINWHIFMFSFTMLPVMDMLLVMMMTIWLTSSLEKRMNRLITLELPEDKVFEIGLIQWSARVIFSQASRREREFHWSDLGFWDKNGKSKSCHPSLNSGLKGLTILHAISGRLTTLNVGLNIFLDVLPYWSDPVMFSSAYVVIFSTVAVNAIKWSVLSHLVNK